MAKQKQKCDICGKMTAPKYGYGKVVCSQKCFTEAGKNYIYNRRKEAF